MSAPRFPYVAVDVPSARADELGALFFELGASGVEVRDEATLQKGPGGDQVTLVASFTDASDASRACQAFSSAEPDLSAQIGEIVGDAWRDKYKEHFKPFRLTDTLVVAPPWEVAPSSDGTSVLIMDPGRAFGTGLHATTSMVAALLEAHRKTVAGARVLDVGTGSGILALVALQLGADRAVAIDNDRDVIEVAADNAARNGFSDAIHVSDIALDHVDGAFDVVLANIRSEVLIAMAPTLAARARAGALVLLSGILSSERDEVVVAFSGDFELVDTKTHAEGTDAWVALAFFRR